MVFIVDDLHLRRSCFGIIYSVDLCWAMRVHIWRSEPLFFFMFGVQSHFL